ncbi:hypothetical protein CR513_44006, partial [Mucuna pruriens]
MAARVCGICTSVEHPTEMCPTLQETDYQYGKQLYQSRPFDNQQFGKQPFQLGASQGPYTAQRFGPAPNAPQGPTGTSVLAVAATKNARSRRLTTDAMLDLRASINFMPTSIYKSLNFGDLEPTRMIIQLANKVLYNS